MSYDVNIHLWLEQDERVHVLRMFASALGCVPVPQHLDNGRIPTRFERIKVYDTSFSKVAVDEIIATNDVAELLSKLEPYIKEKYHCEIASVFDCFHFDEDKKQLEPWLKPLTINYYGPKYDWEGYEYKSYGPIRFDFSNTKVFRVPQPLINHIKVAIDNKGDSTEELSMIAKLNRNFDVVSDLAKRLVKNMNPTHLLVCSNLEVHPLTAHSIYHKNLRDYIEDLKKIVTLHEYGGVYFCDVAPGEPAFIEARKDLREYGYLRRFYNDLMEEDFIERLEIMVNVILQNLEQVELTKKQIEECFHSLVSTEAEKLNDSYYLSAIDSPFSYLEEPYLKLFEAIFGSPIQDATLPVS